jgi:hypothetical protein
MTGMISLTMMMRWMDGIFAILVDSTVWKRMMAVMNCIMVSCAIAVSIVPSILQGNHNMMIQSNLFASYGSADSLNADEQTLREFVGRSSLPLVDQLTVHFLERYQWAMNRTNSDAIRKQPIDSIFV